MVVQSVLLDKDYYTLAQAKKQIHEMGFALLKVDITDRYYRFRQVNPSKNKRKRTVTIKPGLKLIVQY